MKRAAPSKRSPRTFVGFRIDLETKSGTDIKFGAYVYAEDPDFEVLLCAYTPIYRYPGGAEKLGAVRLLDLADPVACAKFARVVTDKRFQKRAFNANFERIALSAWLGMPHGTYIDPENWRCTAVQANVHGVFGTLADVAKAVRSPITKDTEGKRLIRLFSQPINARGASCCSGRFHDRANHVADFKFFGQYCIQDVVTEAVAGSAFPEIPDDVQAEYEADQRVNDRGFRHFKTLSVRAVEQVEVERDRLMTALKVMTGVDNPNSGPQFKRWLEGQDYPMASLDKAHREDALADPLCPDEVREALVLKGAASLSSVTKHKAALNTRCSDGRIRGALRFYGAHTGREAGRGIQPQNLPRYEAPKADRLRLLRGTAGHDAPTIAKGTVRASIVPARGHVFIVPDYNAIEARVLAGLAGEQWAEAEFRGDGKIYEATAATMFNLNKDQLVRAISKQYGCDKCDKCAPCATRAKGKVSNLALGYGGGAGALVTMGAEDAGIDIGNYKELHAEWTALGKPGKFHEWNQEAHDYPELLRMRDQYRQTSPMTTRFWKLCARSWDVASSGKGAKFGQNQCLTMIRDGKHNRMVLPSGRSIWYRFAQSHESKTRDDFIERRTFMGKSMGVGHIRTDTHGGKLCENVTQAVARDVLFDLIMRIEEKTAAGWPARLVLHVHDEVVLEVPEKQADQVLADTIGLMSVAPAWGDFLVVKGEGNIMERYGK